MTDYQPGDKVRIVFEGTVKHHGGGYSAVVIEDSEGISNISPEHVELIERPTRFPEPTEPGTVVRVEYTPGYFSIYLIVGDQWHVAEGDTWTDLWSEVIRGAKSVTVLWPKGEPEWVETEAEYAALPDGSVVATSRASAWTKQNKHWDAGDRFVPSSELDGIRRQVLRRGWGEA